MHASESKEICGNLGGPWNDTGPETPFLRDSGHRMFYFLSGLSAQQWEKFQKWPPEGYLFSLCCYDFFHMPLIILA
jgi:hypothetical protein